MKKLLLPILTAVSICSAQEAEIADCVFAHKQRRIERSAVFLNLLQAANQAAENDSIEPEQLKTYQDRLVYYALDWIQELEQSQEPEDQELCEKLCNIVRTFTQELNTIADKADQAEQAINRHQRNAARTAAFLQLTQAANEAAADESTDVAQLQLHRDKIVYFALNWIKELEQSPNSEDQELCERLCTIIRSLTQELNDIAKQSDQAADA